MQGVERKVLDNGVVVFAQRRDSPDVSMAVDILGGGRDDEKKGNAHFLEHMLFSSNRYKSANEILEAIEFGGATFSARTSHISTRINFSVTPNNLRDLVILGSEIVKSNEYRADELGRESSTITNEVGKMDRNPHTRFNARFFVPHAMRGTPYADATIGTTKSVSEITMDDILRFKRKSHVGSNIIVSVVGGIKATSTLDLVGEHFKDISQGSSLARKITWNFNPRREVVEYEDLKARDKRGDMAYLMFAHKTVGMDHRDSMELQMLVNLLVEGTTSMMHRGLRSERGIGYDFAGSHYCFESNGFLHYGVPGLHPSKLGEAEEIINGMIGRIKEGNLPERYFEGKKNQVNGRYSRALKIDEVHADHHILKERGFRLYTPSEMVRRLSDLRIADVQRVVNEQLGEPLVAIAKPPGYS